MPLVKVIGPKPGTAAEEEDLRAIEYWKSTHITPESAPKQEKKLQPSPSAEDIRIQFRRKISQRDDERIPQEVRDLRSEHGRFILAVHAHAIGYLIVAITQWTLLYYIEALVLFVKMNYYLALIPFALSYIMLMCMIFFYNGLINKRGKPMFYLYTAIMFATIIIALPFSTSVQTHLLFAGIVSIVVIIASIVIASSRQDFSLHPPEYIIAWTLRCFLVTSLGIIFGISINSPQFEVVMTMIMCFFMAILILICGKALSRAEFIWFDKYGPQLYGTLLYLNYIILFSMCVLLFEGLDEVLNL